MSYFLPEEAVKQAFKALTLFPELIYSYRAKVDYWKDGDSLVLDIDRGFKHEGEHILNLEVRLARADTFECRGDEKILGDRAKRAARQRYPKGYDFLVITEKGDRQDYFNRYLIHLYDIKREQVVCTWLIENGHGTEYQPRGKRLRRNLVTQLKFNLKNNHGNSINLF